jgi:hypothetical protein
VAVMTSREIWQFYWNPILLLVLTAGYGLFIYYLSTLPGSMFPELSAWPQVSKIISYSIGLVSLMSAFAWFVHIMLISWATVALETVRGINKAVKHGYKSISKHSFLSGLLVAFIYVVILAYISHEMPLRY